jgi:hypothetical protein
LKAWDLCGRDSVARFRGFADCDDGFFAVLEEDREIESGFGFVVLEAIFRLGLVFRESVREERRSRGVCVFPLFVGKRRLCEL